MPSSAPPATDSAAFRPRRMTAPVDVASVTHGGLLSVPASLDAALLQRQLARRAWAALLVLLMLTAAVGWLTHAILASADAHGLLVNTAGRQRMLSQRILFLAHEVGDTDSDEARISLKHTLAEMQAAHQLIVEEMKRPHAWWEPDGGLQAVYHAGPLYLDAKLHRFWWLARQFTRPELPAADDYDALEALGRAPLLYALEEMVRRVIALNHREMERLGMMASLVLLVSVGAMVAMAFWLFRPAVNIVRLGQQRVEQLHKLKQGFLSTISHEIRTPMNTIFGMAEQLHETGITPQQHGHIAHLLQAAEDLLVLLDNALDLSRLEAGKLALDRVPFNAAKLMDEVVRDHALAAHTKGIALTAHVAADAPVWYVGDPARLRQLLMHLVANAVKFTATGGVRVCLTCEPPPSIDGLPSLVVSVEDTGAGIAHDQQLAIFAGFTHANSESLASEGQSTGGLGVGLAIVHKLVQLMHGVLTLESTLGQGARFSVAIPASLAEVADESAQRDGLQDVRVLLVEDNRINREFTAAMLERMGCRVMHAEHGAVALAQLELHRFDLVLMDCQMPVMDGFAATRQIRQWQAEKRIPNPLPIVALTANTQEGDRERCLAAGMDDYLTKPIRATMLEAMLRQWLQPLAS